MFNILTTTETSTFKCVQDSIIVNGNYTKDVSNNTITNIHGDCYRNDGGNIGANIGYFNGYPNGDEFTYDLSQMSRRDSNLVWDAIDEIESNIITPPND